MKRVADVAFHPCFGDSAGRGVDDFSGWGDVERSRNAVD